MAMCGPKPPGNPDLMIENAGRIVAIVAEMESQGAAVASATVSGSVAAVADASASTASDAARLRAAAGALQAAASSLRSAATKLKAEQDAWERCVKTRAGQLEHEFRRSQAAGS